MKVLTIENLHQVAKLYFRARGFKWEERRTGELGVGYWKVQLGKGERRTYPRRLVIIPGFGDSPLSWHPVSVFLRPWLRSQYDELVFLDFPGFRGFLSDSKSFPTMDELIQATHDALDALKPKTVLGHSLGGWLAGRYGMDCGTGKRPLGNSLNYKGPENLILMNASGVFPDDQTRATWAELFRRAGKEGFEVMRPHVFGKEPFWFKWVSKDLAPFINRDDVVAFMDTVRDDHSIEERAKEIQCRVWLVWGEKDSMIPVSCMGAWLKNIQQGRSADQGGLPVKGVVLHQVGHSPHLEQPLVTATVLGQILSDRTLSQKGRRWWKELNSSS